MVSLIYVVIMTCVCLVRLLLQLIKQSANFTRMACDKLRVRASQWINKTKAEPLSAVVTDVSCAGTADGDSVTNELSVTLTDTDGSTKFSMAQLLQIRSRLAPISKLTFIHNHRARIVKKQKLPDTFYKDLWPILMDQRLERLTIRFRAADDQTSHVAKDQKMDLSDAGEMEYTKGIQRLIANNKAHIKTITGLNWATDELKLVIEQCNQLQIGQLPKPESGTPIYTFNRLVDQDGTLFSLSIVEKEDDYGVLKTNLNKLPFNTAHGQSYKPLLLNLSMRSLPRNDFIHQILPLRMNAVVALRFNPTCQFADDRILLNWLQWVVKHFCPDLWLIEIVAHSSMIAVKLVTTILDVKAANTQGFQLMLPWNAEDASLSPDESVKDKLMVELNRGDYSCQLKHLLVCDQDSKGKRDRYRWQLSVLHKTYNTQITVCGWH